MEKLVAMEFVVFTGFVFDGLESHPHGGLLQNGKNILDFPKDIDSLVSDGGVNGTPHRARARHANIFSRVTQAEFRILFLPKAVISIGTVRVAQCTWLDRIPLPPLHSTPSLLCPLSGSFLAIRNVEFRLAVWSNRTQLHVFELNDPV